MKVVADIVPNDCYYLTAGKEYEVVELISSGFAGEIINDSGRMTYLHFPDCSHLDGLSWRVVDDI